MCLKIVLENVKVLYLFKMSILEVFLEMDHSLCFPFERVTFLFTNQKQKTKKNVSEMYAMWHPSLEYAEFTSGIFFDSGPVLFHCKTRRVDVHCPDA